MKETALKRLCAWPGVTWDIKWGGDLVGSVGGRMFCCLSLADPAPHPLSFKVEDERFLELTDRPGFRPAPYLARARWVTVDDPAGLAPGEARDFLRRAYELIRARLTKKLQRELAED
jgi:predicted DNA-binding protein (MmcQ/YjbR family)